MKGNPNPNLEKIRREIEGIDSNIERRKQEIENIERRATQDKEKVEREISTLLEQRQRKLDDSHRIELEDQRGETERYGGKR